MEDNTDQIKIRHISQSICFRIIDRGIKLSGTMLQPELTFTNDERFLEKKLLKKQYFKIY